jgi:hypothetical protein
MARTTGDRSRRFRYFVLIQYFGAWLVHGHVSILDFGSLVPLNLVVGAWPSNQRKCESGADDTFWLQTALHLPRLDG